MKNKKGLSNVIVKLMIIILILLAIGIIWTSIQNNIPRFIIIEEVCEEETDYSEISKAWDNFYDSLRNIEDDWRKYACTHYSDFSIKNMSEICNELSKLAQAKIDDMSIISFWFEQNKPTTMICEQVEVDEIKLIYDPEIGCSDGYGGRPVYIFTNEDGSYYCGIQKQDLTIEWLDENALCSIICKEDFKLECYDELKRLNVTTRDFWRQSCNEFIYEDYIIEVK